MDTNMQVVANMNKVPKQASEFPGHVDAAEPDPSRRIILYNSEWVSYLSGDVATSVVVLIKGKSGNAKSNGIWANSKNVFSGSGNTLKEYFTAMTGHLTENQLTSMKITNEKGHTFYIDSISSTGDYDDRRKHLCKLYFIRFP